MGRDKIKEIAEQIKQGTYTNANSMIASVNAFLRFMGRLLFRVKIKLERYLLCANYKKSC